MPLGKEFPDEHAPPSRCCNGVSVQHCIQGAYIPWQLREGHQKQLLHQPAVLVKTWVRQEEVMQGSAAQHWLSPLHLSEMQSPAGQHRQRR